MSNNNHLRRILSASNIADAMDVAFFDRALSQIERIALCYVTKQRGVTKDELSSLIFEAVDKKDGDAIRRLASLLDDIKHPKNDTLRTQLLCYKAVLIANNKAAPLADIADLCGIPKTKDKLRTLSRQCKALGVPLFIKPIGRPKKGHGIK